MEDTLKQTCPTCKGSKLVPFNQRVGLGHHKCPTCHGTGQKRLDNEDALEARTAFSRHCFGQEKLDRPDREKIKEVLTEYDPDWLDDATEVDIADFVGAIVALFPTCDCCERPLEVDAQKQKIVDAVKDAKKQGRREVIKEIEEQAGETLWLLEDLKFWHDLRGEK